MSPYLRVARVLFVLALILIGLLIALPMELLSEEYRKLVVVFAAGMLFAAAISFCMGSVHIPHEEIPNDSVRGEKDVSNP